VTAANIDDTQSSHPHAYHARHIAAFVIRPPMNDLSTHSQNDISIRMTTARVVNYATNSTHKTQEPEIRNVGLPKLRTRRRPIADNLSEDVKIPSNHLLRSKLAYFPAVCLPDALSLLWIGQ